MRIPLFPLNLVLFPDSKVPLYIFEERYKDMINMCVKNDEVFGINLIIQKKIHVTGCTSRVDEVTERMESGEMNIIVRGEERYTLLDYEIGPKGYYVGNIEMLPAERYIANEEKVKRSIKYYNELIEVAYKGTLKSMDANDDKWLTGDFSPSFFIAQKCGLTLTEKQYLLELDSEDNRIDYVIKYFEKVMPKLREAEKIATIIKSNGYIQN